MAKEYQGGRQVGLEFSAHKMLQRTLIQQVMRSTDQLVYQALQADWAGVLDGMDARRRLLQDVIQNDAGRFDAEVNALSEAVAESERALMRVIAHAIAGSRRPGAEFAMYH